MTFEKLEELFTFLGMELERNEDIEPGQVGRYSAVDITGKEKTFSTMEEATNYVNQIWQSRAAGEAWKREAQKLGLDIPFRELSEYTEEELERERSKQAGGVTLLAPTPKPRAGRVLVPDEKGLKYEFTGPPQQVWETGPQQYDEYGNIKIHTSSDGRNFYISGYDNNEQPKFELLSPQKMEEFNFQRFPQGIYDLKQLMDISSATNIRMPTDIGTYRDVNALFSVDANGRITKIDMGTATEPSVAGTFKTGAELFPNIQNPLLENALFQGTSRGTWERMETPPGAFYKDAQGKETAAKQVI
jgi:hypothetical protein